jgi:hypothetical protein
MNTTQNDVEKENIAFSLDFCESEERGNYSDQRIENKIGDLKKAMSEGLKIVRNINNS